MLNIEQVRQLEGRVERAVWRISSLTEENRRINDENRSLQDQIKSLQARISELELSVQDFQEEQGRIEEGILSALNKLSAFEDTVISANNEQYSENNDQGY